MKSIAFLREGIRNLRTVGTISRSSRYLCKALLAPHDFSTAKVVVELGAGDGVITEHILRTMRPDAKLLAFEIQPAFYELLSKIPDNRLIAIEDSAEYLPKYLRDHGFEQADIIVSAIPFVIVPKELAQQIVTSSRDCLSPGGRFTQVHYSTLLKSFYESIFDEVKVNFVPLNIPPAFVFSCGARPTP
ncbi:MAG: ribosomal RNA adenine dimethylase [Bacteroidetes bacterium]|nr:MAG: ribosomal RNA adenine dimethylase [Bacteroidota bacterium]